MTAAPSDEPLPEGLSPLADPRWIDCASLNQLLSVILADKDVVATLDACGVDRGELRRGLRARIDANHSPLEISATLTKVGAILRGRPVRHPGQDDVDRVLHRAMVGAGSSDGRIVAATDVLIAILDDTTSEVVAMLRDAGLTRYDALRYVSHGLAKGRPDPDVEHADGVGSYGLILLNDNFTPMEAVVTVLGDHFSLPREAAMRVMLDVHREGRAIIGVYDRDTARAKIDAVTQFGRDHQFPLRCILDQPPTIRGGHAELLT